MLDSNSVLPEKNEGILFSILFLYLIYLKEKHLIPKLEHISQDTKVPFSYISHIRM